MKKSIAIAIVCAFGLASPVLMSPVMASDSQSYTHYEAKPADTLAQAVANFSAYNMKVEAALAGEVTDEKIQEIHQLTYTLETALHKINEEMEQLAETLEALHKASEKLDAEGVDKHGRAYLSVAREVIK